jgi:hypothetical protein
MHRAGTSLVLAMAAAVLAGGCGGDDSTSAGTERVSFQGETGTKHEQIASVGGLTITGSCKNHEGKPFLSVAAETAVDNAVISSDFDQEGSPGGYLFVKPDFDRDYGPWDFLGAVFAEAKSAGTLTFSRPDGAQVSVNFVAETETSQGDCVLGGVAVYAP